MEIEKLLQEVKYKYTHSGGAGGQHVNKVATKVILIFDIIKSSVISEEEKKLVLEVLSNKISKEGLLQLTSSATRSQLKNKEDVTNRFIVLIKKSLQKRKKRKSTKRPHSANLKRLEKKKNQAEKKALRKKKSIFFSFIKV